MSGPPFGVEVFDPVATQLTAADRASILAVQRAVARAFDSYAYLEIGSHLGGSLQPHLRDERCALVYSIDPRPASQADERGERFTYEDNSTERMLERLRPAYGGALTKLRTFESDAREVRDDDLPVRPRLCFIDGEHTDRAVLSDFRSCLQLADRPCLVLFDDANIVYRGIRTCLKEAAAEIARAYVLPSKIAVVEVGDAGCAVDPEVAPLLATAEAYLYATESLDLYRRQIIAIKDLPGVRFARRLRNRILGIEGARGGTAR